MILFIAIVLIFYLANNFIDGNYFNKIIAVSFNTISIISGTGFISENFENWGPLEQRKREILKARFMENPPAGGKNQRKTGTCESKKVNF